MSHLYFNKGDRRIIIILSTIAVIALTAIVLFGTNPREADAPSTQSATPTAGAPTDSSALASSPAPSSALASKPSPVPFDPNTVDSATLVRNGLRPFQAHSLLRYRQAGAVFRKPLDIARLNCLSDEDIDRLLPLVSIDPKYANPRTKYPIGASYDTPSRPTQSESYQSSGEQSDRPSKFTTLTPIDLNTADTTLLKRIPGIGSYTANKIVKMRTLLGGYHSAQQLLSLTNLSSDLLEWFVINPTNLRQINLNSSTFNQLRQHPHIGYDHARDLTRYTRLYGKISDTQQLRSTNIFTDEELQLLLPYVEY